jgi:DNA-binding PadR family transcriptional regulator
MRMTVPTARVLAALLAEPDAERYGLDLMQATGLASGTLYPILHRLREAGWLESAWEEVDPSAEGRPARRYYKLSGHGVEQARQSLAELHAATAPASGKTAGAQRPEVHPA